MKKLPDEKTLNELLRLAKDFEQQALSLYERATEIDDKWRVRLESKRKVAIQKSDGESI
jgi:rubrerythrin